MPVYILLLFVGVDGLGLGGSDGRKGVTMSILRRYQRCFLVNQYSSTGKDSSIREDSI